jgi:hypothetical protein
MIPAHQQAQAVINALRPYLAPGLEAEYLQAIVKALQTKSAP